MYWKDGSLSFYFKKSVSYSALLNQFWSTVTSTNCIELNISSEHKHEWVSQRSYCGKLYKRNKESFNFSETSSVESHGFLRERIQLRHLPQNIAHFSRARIHLRHSYIRNWSSVRSKIVFMKFVHTSRYKLQGEPNQSIQNRNIGISIRITWEKLKFIKLTVCIHESYDACNSLHTIQINETNLSRILSKWNI